MDPRLRQPPPGMHRARLLLLRGLFVRGDGAPDVDLRVVTAKLDELYKIIYGGPMFLGLDALDQLENVCIEFGEAFQRLREHGRVNAQLTFGITPKVHKSQHLPLLAELINPKWLTVYGEESLIGTTMKVYKRSMSGRYKRHIQRNVLLKRVVGLMLRFEAT